MRRATLAALLALAFAVPAAAQGDTWPSTSDLRRDLAVELGWTWAAEGLWWWGGLAGSLASSLRLQADLDGSIHIRVTIFRDHLLNQSWPDAAHRSWTLFREVAARLPIPEAVQQGIAYRVLVAEDGCTQYGLDGGNLTVDRRASWAEVYIDQGSGPRCAELAAIRAEQGEDAAESIAAEIEEAVESIGAEAEDAVESLAP